MATRNPGSTDQLKYVVEIYHYLQDLENIQTVVGIRNFWTINSIAKLIQLSEFSQNLLVEILVAFCPLQNP